MSDFWDWLKAINPFGTPGHETHPTFSNGKSYEQMKCEAEEALARDLSRLEEERGD